MKILAITYCFAPLRFPATYRLLKWFTYLSEQYHDVTVVCVHPDTNDGPKDPELEALVPTNVTPIVARSGELNLAYRFLDRWKTQCFRLFQPHKRPWLAPAWTAVRRLPLSDYDVVFSCSQPTICHLLGLKVARAAKLPWVAYFSDPWVDNPYQSSTPAKIVDYNRIFEKEVFLAADQLLFSSEETAQLVLQNYPAEVARKTQVLNHCYVPAWFDLKKVEDVPEGGPLRVLLTGNFYGPRTPIPFLERLHTIDATRSLAGGLAFEFYGIMAPDDATHPLWAELNPLVRFRGEVSYLESLAFMRAADALLLIDAPVAAGQSSIFFPSKLTEYLGSGRPIIGFTPAQGTAARILASAGCPVLAPDDTTGIEKCLRQMASEGISGTPHREVANRYHYHRVGEQLVDIMTMAIHDAPHR